MLFSHQLCYGLIVVEERKNDSVQLTYFFSSLSGHSVKGRYCMGAIGRFVFGVGREACVRRNA
ncbi:MAG: hypothetical protein OHK0046_17030 [Anaerolineae bacterium]